MSQFSVKFKLLLPIMTLNTLERIEPGLLRRQRESGMEVGSALKSNFMVELSFDQIKEPTSYYDNHITILLYAQKEDLNAPGHPYQAKRLVEKWLEKAGTPPKKIWKVGKEEHQKWTLKWTTWSRQFWFRVKVEKVVVFSS